MHKYLLRFQSSKCQEQYQKYSKRNFFPIFQGYSMIFQIIYLIFAVDNFSYNLSGNSYIIGIVRICQFCIQVLAHYFIKEHHYKFQMANIYLMTLINTVLIFEKMIFQQLIIQDIHYLIAGLNIGFNIATGIYLMEDMIIARTTLLFLIFLYIKIRFELITWTLTFYILLLSIILFLYSYFTQKKKMIQFIDFFNNQNQLEHIKNIMYSDLTDGIVIISQSDAKNNPKNDNHQQNEFKIQYCNQKFEQMINHPSINNISSQNQKNLNILESIKQMKVIILQNHSQTQLNYQQSFYEFLDKLRIQPDRDKVIFKFQDFKIDNDKPISSYQNNSFQDLGSSSLFNSQQFFNIKSNISVWDGQPSIMFIIKNITKKQRISQLIQNNQYKDQILATVSHDLKTPINGIIAQIESVENNDFSQKNEINQILKVFQTVKINISLLLFLVYDIQDYSQIIKKQIRIVTTQYNLIQATLDCIELIRIQAAQKGLKIIEDWNDYIENMTINNDQLRYKQVLLNLLSNALKCTNSGFIKISLQIIDQILIEVSVEDTGCGITSQQMENLFELYKSYQNDKKQHGVGLGLFITKKLVGRLGPYENINVNSQVNKGSCFKFLIYQNLIRQKSPTEKSIKIKNNDQSNKENNKGEDESLYHYSQQQFEENIIINQQYFQINRFNNTAENNTQDYQILNKQINILIVDDDVFCIQAFKTLCQGQSVVVQEAYNGKDAIDKCYTKNYDAVFLDMNMPILGGLEAAEQIRKIQKMAFIVLLTSNNQLQGDCKFLSLFLQKPIKRDKLQEIFNHIRSKQ